jgi:type IV secretion system protein VirD4
MIILFALLSVAVVWLALITANCYEDGIKLFDLLEQLVSALNQPWYISINQYSLKFVLLFLLAYSLGVGMYFSQSENRRPGEEHG